MKNQLARVFDEILYEIKQNPDFKKRIERILEFDEDRNRNSDSARRRSNRRARGVVDPYREYAVGGEQLRQQLERLTLDQLKDIVSEHALDSSRLALKWKNPARLIELIITTVRSRMEKGDAFRG